MFCFLVFFHIVITYQHFLVSKDGTPLTDFIQDHVVVDTPLTIADRFFVKKYNFVLLKKIISTILLYIQSTEEAQLNIDSKSKFSMKVRNSKEKGKQNNN
ncbi:unnamed protein product [Rotaria sordida]|uniref:Uncharacterized protein n=1 Tax=Rotaria sordida TaxID=392033 RepID=A0A815VZA1_9BILA|nr:unnamed protein product [Rotaria sordida]CAF1669827.1 unnamed protein product [Rotaria sordida]